MRFGVHVSIAGSLKEAIKRAKERGCECMQIFTRNPRGWAKPKECNEKELSDFKEGIKKANIYPLIVHLPYLPNIASSNASLYRKSMQLLFSELEQAYILGAKFVVVHMGSYGEGTLDEGIKRIIDCVNEATERVEGDVMLLLENMGGGGREVGASFEEIAKVLEGIKRKEKVGICFDICHAYIAGYDLSSSEKVKDTFELFDKIVGIEKIKLLHANDTDSECGSHLDKHQDIGKGKLSGGFSSIVNHPFLKELPCILETPTDWKNPAPDIMNLKAIRSYVIE